jgi:major membrane immunogen (membrane-anchored lipoprotein)
MSRWHVAARLAGTMLLAAMLLGACGSSTTPSPVSSSPAAVIDTAVVDRLSGVFDGAFDPAKVAALYATNATLYDTIAGQTSTGLEAIQAKLKTLAGAGFTSKPTTLPIAQGEFVAFFEDHGTAAGHEPGLVVIQVRDGKILSQWVYPVG